MVLAHLNRFSQNGHVNIWVSMEYEIAKFAVFITYIYGINTKKVYMTCCKLERFRFGNSDQQKTKKSFA